LGHHAHQHQGKLRHLLQGLQEGFLVQRQDAAVLARGGRGAARHLGDGRHFAEDFPGRHQVQRLAGASKDDIAIEQQVDARTLGKETGGLFIFGKNLRPCRELLLGSGQLEKSQRQLGLVKRGGFRRRGRFGGNRGLWRRGFRRSRRHAGKIKVVHGFRS
jgi:hypothetical protein